MLLLMKKVKTDVTPPKKEQEPPKLDALSKLCQYSDSSEEEVSN